MRCEIVAIGTELLLGQIVDTNSSWMGEQLALAGIDSHFQTKVGDNLERMIASIRLALSRSDAVILCGGLGPTQDDITREAIAAVMEVGLVRHDDIGERVRERFNARGREMPANNLRQADVPEGAAIIEEMPGTAPGLVCPLGEQVIYAVPGVPYEMREMMSGTIIADLRRRAGLASVIKSRVLRTWGESESGLAERLGPRITELDAIGNPTLAFLASGMEGIKVRITAKAGSEAEAEATLADEENRLRAMLGDIVFAVDEHNMESTVINLLAERGQRLAVAEAATGGLVSARLTEVAAAATVLTGSVLCVADATANTTLSVATTTGPAAAQAMAVAVCDRLMADYGLATARPESDAERERGTVHLGVAGPDAVITRAVHLPGDHIRVRQYAVISLLDLLRRQLLS